MLLPKPSRLRGIQTYSEELGLDLRRPRDRFKWFLASMLFAKRISSTAAKNTFRKFSEEGLITPDAIMAAGWDKLVKVLDSGGYVRYDFSTATNLLSVSDSLLKRYGSLERLHRKAKSPEHLEEMLMEFKGVGPVAANIFLRELRGIWEKANPAPSPLALRVARRLRLRKVDQFESQLVRLELEFCRKGKCDVCPVAEMCSDGRDQKRRGSSARAGKRSSRMS